MSASLELDDARDARIAGLCAALLIATQVAGKATRDALFLSSFAVERLPLMIAAAGLLSLLFVFLASRLFREFGPIRLVPWALLLSAATLLAMGLAATRAPTFVAIAVFLHFAVAGGVLLSGFWSALNERFDPRAARQRFGRIALGGTLGGLLGGLAAERLAALSSASVILITLAVLHLACAMLLRRIPDPKHAAAVPRLASKQPESSWQELLRIGYLRNLATLILIVTVAGVLLDYVFKVRATGAVQSQEELLRFFALFYTAVALVTFLVQAGASDRLLEKFGLANTVSTLPVGVAIVSGVSLAVPGLATAALSKALEATLRSSTFRSGYEPLFVPLPLEQKRKFKQFIDVGCERIGDLIGAAVVAALVFLLPTSSLPVLLGFAFLLGVAGVFVTRRLNGGWVNALANRLEDHAAQLDMDAERSSTKTVVFRTLDAIELRRAPQERETTSAAVKLRQSNPEAKGYLVLVQGRSDQIRHLLVRTPQLPVSWLPAVIKLLARDELKDVAARALRGAAVRNSGQLLDHLLDTDEDFSVRRRIPPLLMECSAERVAGGLFLGLRDRRFEVRYQCARTLLHLREREGELPSIQRDAVLAAVLAEVEVGKHIWEGHRLLDEASPGTDSPFDEAALRKRSALGLEHIFTLLALTLPSSPLSVAYRGLFTDDAALRGTALEYLESVLPDRVRMKLWPYLDVDSRPATSTVDQQELVDRLMRSHVSIQLNLERQQLE